MELLEGAVLTCRLLALLENIQKVLPGTKTIAYDDNS